MRRVEGVRLVASVIAAGAAVITLRIAGELIDQSNSQEQQLQQIAEQKVSQKTKDAERAALNNGTEVPLYLKGLGSGIVFTATFGIACPESRRRKR